MKVMVAYMSKTGNTKKVAEAIYEEIADDKEIKAIDQVDSTDAYDVVFLGFPIHKMGPDKKTLQLLGKHCVSGRNVVLFITHAAPEDSPELPPMLDKFRQAASGANIVDMFDCQGQLARGVKMIMSVMPDAKLRRWAREDNSQGQPDEGRVAKARAFCSQVMQKLHTEARVVRVEDIAVPA